MPSNGFYTSKVGDIELFALHEGFLMRDRPPGFVKNATEEDVENGFSQVGIPKGKLIATFTPLAFRRNGKVTLVDVGFGDNDPPAGFTGNGLPTTGRFVSHLAAVGITPADVSTIVISHLHIDHIAGLRNKDGTFVYPNAELLVPETEWKYWTDESRASAAPQGYKPNFALVKRTFEGQSDRIRLFGWGKEVAPGVTSIATPGHTPGHTGFQIADGNEHLIVAGDLTNNPFIFARHPGWHIGFDMDPNEAEKSRRQMLDRTAADRSRIIFYHAPFPAIGYVGKNATGYDYFSEIWT